MEDDARLSAAGDNDNPQASSVRTFRPQSSVTGYVEGTLIRTARGDMPIESLQIGDHVVISSGETRTIRWIGHRVLSCVGRPDALPVRIVAHAVAEDCPSRDLYVSPTHTICIDALGEIFIPINALLNGSTIVQIECDAVAYWHVELDSHDVILAENLKSESYLDRGNRSFFADDDEYDSDLGENTHTYCRPVYDHGPVLDAIRLRLRARARNLTSGWRLEAEPFADLHLLIDGQVTRPSVDGLRARFLVPTRAHDVRLMSTTVVPADVVDGSGDGRLLGISLCELVIDDGLTGVRNIALDDARLNTGFHPAEFVEQAVYWRWTNGAAVLPRSLWEGCQEMFFLRVTLAAPALPRWVGPGETRSVVGLERSSPE